MQIGVLGLQGAVCPHFEPLRALGAEPCRVREAADLEGCDGLILPGGESSTMLHLVAHYRLEEALRAFALRRPLWGICAGAILMAEKVSNPAQRGMGTLAVEIQRNAYGRQNESFITTLTLNLDGLHRGRDRAPGDDGDAGGGDGADDSSKFVQEAVFIRAPRIEAWGPQIEVLASYQEHPVALSDGKHLITTFHPELSPALHLHRYFLDRLCAACDSA